MATLLAIRTALNAEIGVLTDAETSPWTQAVRSQAISDGYAALYRAGVWKAVKQDLASVDGQVVYAAATPRRLNRIELLDSSGYVASRPVGIIEPDGSGTNQLTLKAGTAVGYTLRVYGWAAYKSVFTSDTDTDDIEAENARVPRLKAKAILYRQQLALFARYGERQNIAPTMNMTIDQLLGVVAAAEREFTDECRVLSNLRVRVGQSR